MHASKQASGRRRKEGREEERKEGRKKEKKKEREKEKEKERGTGAYHAVNWMWPHLLALSFSLPLCSLSPSTDRKTHSFFFHFLFFPPSSLGSHSPPSLLPSLLPSDVRVVSLHHCMSSRCKEKIFLIQLETPFFFSTRRHAEFIQSSLSPSHSPTAIDQLRQARMPQPSQVQQTRGREAKRERKSE